MPPASYPTKPMSQAMIKITAIRYKIFPIFTDLIIDEKAVLVVIPYSVRLFIIILNTANGSLIHEV
jgi:hypothetical protein